MDEDTKMLLNRALIGATLGAGTLAGAKLTHELIQAIKGPPEPDNVIRINIPKERLHKQSSFFEEHPNLTNYLKGVGDLTLRGAVFPASFGLGMVGAAKMYKALKQKQLEQELNSAENQYLATLHKVKEKTAAVLTTATPKTDQLITNFLKEKVATIEEAGLGLLDLIVSPFKAFGGYVQDTTKQYGPQIVDQVERGVEKGVDKIKEQIPIWQESASKSPLTQLPAAAWLLGALGSGGLTYHLLNRADQAKEENKKNKLPTEVVINPV